jgi:hypothetical protein
MSEKSRRQVVTDESELVRLGAAMAAALVCRERERQRATQDELRKRVEQRWGIPAKRLFDLAYPCRWPREIGAGLFRTLEHAVRREADIAEKAGHTTDTSAALRVARAALAELEK